MDTDWSKLTIHIGMPKCASTSLQCNFFSNAGFPYLGPTNVHFNFRDGLEERFKYLLALSTMEEHRYHSYREEIESFLYQYFSPEQPGIISDEGISCGYYGAIPEECNDRSVVARRYAELFPGAKILLIIRNQPDFLASLFGEWNRRTFIHSPDIHRWFRECLNLHTNMVSNPLCMPDFAGIYQIYSELFEGRVKVLPLEQLKMDSRSFLNEVAEYAEINVTDDIFVQTMDKKLNTRIKPFEKIVYTFFVNHPRLRNLIPGDFRKPLYSLVGKVSSELQVEFDAWEKQKINDIYASGNRILVEKTGLQLDSLGYPI